MTAASGYSELIVNAPGTVEMVTSGASGRSSLSITMRGRVLEPSTSPASGASFLSIVAVGTVEFPPITPGPERWDAPRYRFVGG